MLIEYFFPWLLGFALGGLVGVLLRDGQEKVPPPGLSDRIELKILELQKHYKFKSRNATLTAAIDLLEMHKRAEAMYVRQKGGEFELVQIHQS